MLALVSFVAASAAAATAIPTTCDPVIRGDYPPAAARSTSRSPASPRQPEAIGEERRVPRIADVDRNLGHVARPGDGQLAGRLGGAREHVGDAAPLGPR